MARCIFYVPKQEEAVQLLVAVREQAAFETEESLDCSTFQNAKEAAAQMREHGTTVLGWDVSEVADLDVLKELRAECRDAFLLAVAEETTSPLTFLTPTIAPTSLIIRPMIASEVRRVAKEIVAFIHQSGRSDGEIFTITYRNEQFRIPYDHIYYFEARGRKLYIRLRQEEIGFLGTLEQLETTLPRFFRRCHRSFIVNMGKIDRILWSQNTICLGEDRNVPLSRNFKKMIKERHDED